MQISRRLGIVARMLAGCNTIYDIGSDHGLLPVYMLLEDMAEYAVLSDISAPAIERGRNNVIEYDLEDRASVRVGDGLIGLSPKEEDAVSICGMGGLTVLDILTAAGDIPCPMVLQANTDHEDLRKGLQKMGYAITDEAILRENGKFYIIIKAEKGEMRLTDEEAFFGPILLKEMSGTLVQFANWQKSVYEKASCSGPSAETARRMDVINRAFDIYFT
ncbi:MAG: SAM-dependent methyltransferase [Clostridiales bacterium]|nr:SAM-dependent methyltransferase [Clostridiales bacterium]